jgi:hypothetical protein
VIKKRARVPAGDSFVVRRIAGPGLASNYFYQVRGPEGKRSDCSRIRLIEDKAKSLLLLKNNLQKDPGEAVYLTEYIFYCKRAILFLLSSKILTPYPPLECVPPAFVAGGGQTRRAERGMGGQYFGR